jgi:predicted HAD superfamily Cof-like phosphohydrolase
MKEFIGAVVQFNQEILGISQRTPMGMLESEEAITIKCLREELEELMHAMELCSVVDQVDAIIDLIYFAIGALYKIGLTEQQIHDCCMAVHTANMLKKKGVNAKRETGAADAVKPADWIAPEAAIHGILFGK